MPERNLSIVMVIQQFRPVVGGAELQAERLSRELAERGHRITVLTAGYDPQWPVQEVLAERLTVIRLPQPKKRFVGSAMFLAAAIAWLLRNRRGIDVIHVHQALYPVLPSVLAGKLTDKPVIVKVACAGLVGDLAQLGTGPAGRLVRWAYSGVTRFISLSSAIEEEWRNEGIPSARMVRIPNGVDTRTFAPVTDPSQARTQRDWAGRYLVLFSGRLVPEKGALHLLQACSALPADLRERLQVVFAGGGPQRDELEARAAYLQLRVSFLGAVSNMADLYRTVDLAVLPSLTEGLSNVLLEAMSCGLPVISTRVSGSEDVIEPGVNGLLVPPGEPVELAAAMARVMEDAGLAGELGRRARETMVKQYSLQAVASRYEALYEELLS